MPHLPMSCDTRPRALSRGGRHGRRATMGLAHRWRSPFRALHVLLASLLDDPSVRPAMPMLWIRIHNMGVPSRARRRRCTREGQPLAQFWLLRAH